MILFHVPGSTSQVSRGVVCLCLAVACCLLPVTAWSADPACLGVYEPMPMQVDPMTAEMDLPCFNGFPAPMGHPGALPFYDGDGQLGWVDSDGSVLSQFGVVVDNVRMRGWAEQSGRSLGEKIMLLKDNQMRKGRALSIGEVING